MGETGKKQKLFYKIGEVSHITGLESYVLRFWETEFPDLHPKKNSGRQRLYTDKDIEIIFKIKKLLYVEGLTIPGARKRLGSRVGGRALIEKVRKELRGVLTLLQPPEK